MWQIGIVAGAEVPARSKKRSSEPAARHGCCELQGKRAYSVPLWGRTAISRSREAVYLCGLAPISGYYLTYSQDEKREPAAVGFPCWLHSLLHVNPSRVTLVREMRILRKAGERQ